MELRLAIENYRCFSADEPARYVLAPGVTAFVGANNAGKTALLRFFWEFRPVFAMLSTHSPKLLQAVGRVAQAISFPIADASQLFCDSTSGAITVDVEILGIEPSDRPLVDRFQIEISRPGTLTALHLFAAGQAVEDPQRWEGAFPKAADGRLVADLNPMYAACNALAQTRLVGFRRTTTSQGGGRDFDVDVGGSLVARWRGLKGGPKPNRVQAAQLEDRLREVFGLNSFGLGWSENGQDLIAEDVPASVEVRR